MSATPTPRLKVSREGMVLIKSFEGFRPHAVQEADGRWVIGYGHTASAREGLTVGEADAELLLQYDLIPVVKALNDQARGPLNQHQFDALASFAVSVGVDRFLASDVLQRLNEGQAGRAADALIGWPEDASAEVRLRRRAAERALFVADPAAPVTLAELLAAPLPPPPVEAPATPDPEPGPEPGTEAPVADARAAAVAALLGETAPAAESTGPADPQPAEPAPAEPEPSWAPQPPAFETPAFQAIDAVTQLNLDRYSPYSAAIIGPLPGFESLEPAVETAPEPAPAPEPEPSAPVVETPVIETPPVDPAVPAEPLQSAAPTASPFPPLDPPLVLTPATEADFAETGRMVWPADERAAPPEAEETALFEDEPTLSVLRHEVEPDGPRGFEWGDTGMYMIMGGVGLLACAFSAAAFRKGMTDDSYIGDFTIIGWVLALIGVLCVGVSSWNLFMRWGKSD